jgi:hypothetical protein
MQLSRLDRYEGRAFARRNRAIRAFVPAAARGRIGRTKPIEKREGFQGAPPASPLGAPAVRTGDERAEVPAAERQHRKGVRASELTKQSQPGKANDFSEPVTAHRERRGMRAGPYRFAAFRAYPAFNHGMRVMRWRPSPPCRNGLSGRPMLA